MKKLMTGVLYPAALTGIFLMVANPGYSAPNAELEEQIQALEDKADTKSND